MDTQLWLEIEWAWETSKWSKQKRSYMHGGERSSIRFYGGTWGKKSSGSNQKWEVNSGKINGGKKVILYPSSQKSEKKHSG